MLIADANYAQAAIATVGRERTTFIAAVKVLALVVERTSVAPAVSTPFRTFAQGDDGR